MHERNGDPAGAAPAEAGANIVITGVTIHPPREKPIEVPLERFKGNGPGLVSVLDGEGGLINYYGFPYVIRFRQSEVLAPKGSRIHLG